MHLGFKIPGGRDGEAEIGPADLNAQHGEPATGPERAVARPALSISKEAISTFLCSAPPPHRMYTHQHDSILEVGRAPHYILINTHSREMHAYG